MFSNYFDKNSLSSCLNKKLKYNLQYNIYKIITILFVIASIAMLIMVSIFPLLVDGGRQVATAVGEPGDVILTISTSILFPIWMISMSIITIWSIVTGFIFLKKD